MTRYRSNSTWFLFRLRSWTCLVTVLLCLIQLSLAAWRNRNAQIRRYRTCSVSLATRSRSPSRNSYDRHTSTDQRVSKILRKPQQHPGYYRVSSFRSARLQYAKCFTTLCLLPSLVRIQTTQLSWVVQLWFFRRCEYCLIKTVLLIRLHEAAFSRSSCSSIVQHDLANIV